MGLSFIVFFLLRFIVPVCVNSFKSVDFCFVPLTKRKCSIPYVFYFCTTILRYLSRRTAQSAVAL